MKYLFWISVKANKLLDFTFREKLLKQRSSFKRDLFLVFSLLITIISWLVIVAAPPFIFGWFLTAFGVPFKVKDIFQFLSFFVWIWILSLQKTRDQKNKMNSKKRAK